MGSLLGHSPPLRSNAIDINNAGQVVGWSDARRRPGGLAFLWDETNGMQGLGTLEGGDWSSARAINNARRKSSAGSGSPTNETLAFIWDAENGMRPLESPEGDLAKAYDINDAGQIIGWAPQRPAALWDNGVIVNLNCRGRSSRGWHFSRIRAINASGPDRRLGSKTPTAKLARVSSDAGPRAGDRGAADLRLARPGGPRAAEGTHAITP